MESLGHYPAGKWSFDEGVADCFDDMLKRSIPQYVAMRELVRDLALRFVHPGADVLDLGCSRGQAIADILEGGRERIRCAFGCEVSVPMVQAARSRFAAERPGKVTILEQDITHGLPTCYPRVVLSVLTLQFVPTVRRQRVITKVADILDRNGAFIVVEKVLGDTSRIDSLLVGRYHELKRTNGYSDAEIEAKRKSLEGVLSPLTAADNERWFRRAGFSQVDCVWRWCNFAAWLCVK